jgi:hypothetical protein
MCRIKITETKYCPQLILAIRTCSREDMNLQTCACLCSRDLEPCFSNCERCTSIDGCQNTVFSPSLLGWSHHLVTRRGKGPILTLNAKKKKKLASCGYSLHTIHIAVEFATGNTLCHSPADCVQNYEIKKGDWAHKGALEPLMYE